MTDHSIKCQIKYVHGHIKKYFKCIYIYKCVICNADRVIPATFHLTGQLYRGWIDRQGCYCRWMNNLLSYLFYYYLILFVKVVIFWTQV